jgi:hypothetical protein
MLQAAWDNLNNQIAGKKGDPYALLAGIEEKGQDVDEHKEREREDGVIRRTADGVQAVVLDDRDQPEEEDEVGEVL